MKILVISPTPTSPADQGNRQRVKRLCQALKARGAEIHFGYFPREWGGRFSPQEQIEMTEEWDFYDTIVPSKPFVYQTSDRYFGIDDWWDDAIGRFIEYKVGGENFDACIVNYAFFSKAFEYLPRDVIRILDTHDRLSGRREMLESYGVDPEFFYTTEEQEQLALKRADIILAINEEEGKFFGALSGRPVITMGHVVDREEVVPVPRTSGQRFRMGFLGSSNSVNVKNMNNFLEELALREPKGESPLQIDIYGSCCSRIKIPESLNTPINLMGRVDEVSEFYANSDCVFVPFLFGTGQKIKLIEALSFGVPILATESASEGSGSDAPLHLMQTFDEVITAMWRFAEDPYLRADLAAETERQFNKYRDQIESSLDALYDLAGVKSLGIAVDRASVARSLSGLPRSEIVATVVRCTPIFDMLNWFWQPEGKEEAMAALRAGVQDALNGTPSEAEDSVAPDTWARVIFDGMSPPGRDTGAEIRFHLPHISTGVSPQQKSNCLNMLVDMPPERKRRDILPLTTLISVGDKDSSAANQIVMLVNDIRDPGLPEVTERIQAGVALRCKQDISIVIIDQEGRHMHWDGSDRPEILEVSDPFDILPKMRGIVLSKPSVAVAVGFSHVAAKPLHRILINDCGLLVSLNGTRATAVDGEIITHNPGEAAIWIALAASAAGWAQGMELRRRQSVGAREDLASVARAILKFLNGLREKRMVEVTTGLFENMPEKSNTNSRATT